jgi:glycosyltransferase involved in cell wall biosynthesis
MTFNDIFHYLKQRIRTAIRYRQEHGLRATLALIWQTYRHPRPNSGLSGTLFPKRRVIEFYDFVRSRPVGTPIAVGTVERTTINWVVPPWGFGSGGHLNIFRFVYYLEQEGFNCRIVVVGEPKPLSAEDAYKQINNWFFPLKGDVYIGINSAPPAHITIATSWQTAYYVRSFQSTVHRCYFVQDFEPYFYAAGAEYAWAEETYRFGFFGITAGSWLKDKLAADYGMRTEAFSFSYDRNLYSQHKRREPEIRRIFFYARPPTERRAFQLGILVLDEVTRRMPEVKVIFAGWDISEYHIPFEHLNGGVLGLHELPDLYSQCDVALVLSFTNLSLLPLELMACGTPVVSNRAPCTEWLLNKDNCLLASPTVEALADALCNVLTTPIEVVRLRHGGFVTAACTDWKIEANKVGDILRNLDTPEQLK